MGWVRLKINKREFHTYLIKVIRDGEILFYTGRSGLKSSDLFIFPLKYV